MIVSHRHRFIFFAVPRTATHAIRAALADDLGDEDWQQEALATGSRLPIPQLARLGHGHMGWRQVQPALPEPVRGYFKFAFVRNPFDRFVSACAMLNKRNPDYRGAERRFMKRALQVPRFRARVLVRPQACMLVDSAHRLGMDYVGRYETLQRDFDEVCKQLGLAPRPLALANVAEHADYRTVYDAELERLVADFYRVDFDLFGYPSTLCG